MYNWLQKELFIKRAELDAFFDTMKSSLTDATYDAYQQLAQETEEHYDLGISYHDTDSLREQELEAIKNDNMIFKFWLLQVPSDLKIGKELKPDFKNAVRSYLMETRNFDPYEYETIDEIPDDIVTPSAEDLDSQWR